jgi:hypothetical protein
LFHSKQQARQAKYEKNGQAVGIVERACGPESLLAGRNAEKELENAYEGQYKGTQTKVLHIDENLCPFPEQAQCYHCNDKRS